ncbi:glycosyltransferase family 4 protein [Streptococcus sp. S784/96/1]|uniref:glycosyltransferase family 4 protein n=1 Tax=Streptococcus sp. S784/96/1 TaxID=2653499 RepID=UPI00138A6892|nr:glycosyltransferase family 4 protein [Streptococcus sp. S784/96/1]
METNIKTKHILVISQYFYPEEFRINDICCEWVKRGYKVTVVTGIPNYPIGEFFDGYSYEQKRTENWNGIDIIRLPILPRRTGSLSLIKNYFSFVREGLKWVKKTKIRADLVYTFEVSPMTQALVGVKYAKKFKVPHFLYITDLWPENVSIITGIKSKILLYPIQLMVDYIYKNSDYILTASKSFVPSVLGRNVPDYKVEYWPQYVEQIYGPISNPPLIPEMKSDVLNFVFAGNLGQAQNLGILVQAAQQLRSEDILVRFTLIGDGRYKKDLLDQVERYELHHYFQFIDRKSSSEIPIYLAQADVLLILLAKSEVFAMTIPAKTQSCMASGKPILVSADGEVQSIISEAEAGLTSGAENVEAFVENIKQFLSYTEQERVKLGENALRYSEEHFKRERLLKRLDSLFDEYTR